MTADGPVVEFRVVDVERDARECVAFLSDTFEISFDDPARFRREFGEEGERYLAWLREAVRDHPEGHVHAWIADEIVGQISMRPLAESPETGYVNLVYVKPRWRGAGVAAKLDAYAVGWLRAQGCRRARLSVSETNRPAIRFYERQGWVDVGPRPGKTGERVMERALRP